MQDDSILTSAKNQRLPISGVVVSYVEIRANIWNTL